MVSHSLQLPLAEEASRAAARRTRALQAARASTSSARAVLWNKGRQFFGRSRIPLVLSLSKHHRARGNNAALLQVTNSSRRVLRQTNKRSNSIFMRSTILTDFTPTNVRFDDDTFWVEVADGRALGIPYQWFPRLAGASAAARLDYELSPLGIHWDALDEDIRVAAFFEGRGDETRRNPA